MGSLCEERFVDRNERTMTKASAKRTRNRRLKAALKLRSNIGKQTESEQRVTLGVSTTHKLVDMAKDPVEGSRRKKVRVGSKQPQMSN